MLEASETNIIITKHYQKDRHHIFLILIFPDEVTSVYVRNLPANVTEAEIDQEFKNFGRIKPDGIFIRVRKVAPLFGLH